MMVATLLSTLLGVATTLWIEKAHKRIKRLWWGIKNITYKVDYFGKQGQRRISQNGDRKYYTKITRDLSICRFVFWSSGKEILLNSDVSSVEPLILTFNEDCEIAGIENFAPSNRTIFLKVINLHQILIDFEYLESDDGAVFDILYAGNNAKPYLSGVVKGGKVDIRQTNPPDLSGMPRHQLLFGRMKPAKQIVALKWFYAVGFILIVSYSLMAIMNPSAYLNSDPFLRGYAVSKLILSFVGCIIFIRVLWNIVIVPPKLRMYYNKIVVPAISLKKRA